MEYVLKSDKFLDGVEKAGFLSENNIPIYMNDGEFVIPNRELYLKSLILLFFSGYITEEELSMNGSQPLIKEFNEIEVLCGDASVCFFENADKYFLIQKSDDSYNVIVKNCTNDLNEVLCDIEFFASKGNDTSDVLKVLHRVNSDRIYENDSTVNSNYIEIEDALNGVIFRVVRKEEIGAEDDKNTVIFNFKEGSKGFIKMNFLFNELKEKNLQKDKIMLKNK